MVLSAPAGISLRPGSGPGSPEPNGQLLVIGVAGTHVDHASPMEGDLDHDVGG